MYHEIILPITTGKSTGPDHRQTLYNLLLEIKPNSKVSSVFLTTTVPLVVKETNDAALSVLAQAIPSHFVFHLHSGGAIEKAVSDILVKEIISPRPSLRRAIEILIGESFYNLEENPWPENATIFFNSLLPGIEKSLKDISTSPLAIPSGPLDGWILLTILLQASTKSSIGKLTYDSKS